MDKKPNEYFLELFLDKIYELADSSLEVIPTIEKLYDVYKRDNVSSLYEDGYYSIYVSKDVIHIKFNLYESSVRIVYNKTKGIISSVVLICDFTVVDLMDRDKLLKNYLCNGVAIHTKPFNIKHGVGAFIKEDLFPIYITMLDFYSKDIKCIEERVKYFNELNKMRYDEE